MRILTAACAVFLLVATGWSVLSREERGTPAATIAVAEALGGTAEAGYARARAPRPFVFPEDHGPHPAFRNEWWYFTGNLLAADGRHFGYELTFFRTALAPSAPSRASAWATTQVYMAHFAVTDTARGRFLPHARSARGAVGLAGATAAPFHVWTEDWSAAGEGRDGTPARLRAADGEAAIDLTLERGKPLVLQGDRGWSRKGPEEGNASYYYSLTRMPTRGTITVDGKPFAVEGLSWMDREWSTSALGRNVGWDWFALQLDDGRDLMVYRLRHADGSIDPFSAGTIVAANGRSRALAAADVQIDVLGWWSSPDGVRYPARWRLGVPSERFVVDIVPRLADQELRAPVRYWEGAVTVRGADGGRTAGSGYVELVGYAR